MKSLLNSSLDKYVEKLNLGYIVIFIILLVVPLTQALVKQEHVLTKEAVTNSCAVRLAEPIIELNSIEFTYPPLCQAAESHENAGQLENCDDYYIGWWCSPKANTTQHMVVQACRGWANSLTSPYKVDFRNRVNYIRESMLQNLIATNSVDARRSVWNYLMTEVKSSNTTFGLEDPEADLNYASFQIFNRSWEEVKKSEIEKNCSTSAWQDLCRNDSPNIKDLTCRPGFSCSSYPSTTYSNTPFSFTCVKIK